MHSNNAMFRNACLPSLRPNLLAFGANISTQKEEVLKIGFK